MRRCTTRVLVMMGICWLCGAGIVFAQNGNPGTQGHHENQGPQGHHGHPGYRASAPEIDVGAAAGALTIAAGGLALLAERLRRP